MPLTTQIVWLIDPLGFLPVGDIAALTPYRSGSAMPDGHLRQPSCGQKLSAPARHRARNRVGVIQKQTNVCAFPSHSLARFRAGWGAVTGDFWPQDG